MAAFVVIVSVLVLLSGFYVFLAKGAFRAELGRCESKDLPGGWKLKKTKVEQYQFNGPNAGLWAIITLDPRGIFQAVSDLGNYSYEGWGGHGQASFKHFLVRLDEAGYFLEKMCGVDRWIFSHKQTFKYVRERICEKRRDGSIDKTTARECWDELKAIGHPMDSHDYVDGVTQYSPTLYLHIFQEDPFNVADSCSKELAPMPLRFFKEIFREQLVPVLREELGKEISS
jgi:hypothetical protein